MIESFIVGITGLFVLWLVGVWRLRFLEKRVRILEAAVAFSGRDLGKRLEETGSQVKVNGIRSWEDVPDWEFE